VGKWLRLDGSSAGNLGIIRPSTLGDRLYPAVASGRVKTLVVWVHYRDDPNYQDIWGTILGPNLLYLPLIIR